MNKNQNKNQNKSDERLTTEYYMINIVLIPLIVILIVISAVSLTVILDDQSIIDIKGLIIRQENEC